MCLVSNNICNTHYMEEVVLLLMSSSSAAVVLCAVLFWLWKNGYLDALIPSSKGPSGPGDPLPTPSLKKGVKPWFILNITTDKNLSLYQGKLRISYTPGKIGSDSGGGLHANPFQSLPADSCVFSCKVYVPSNANFVKGGKLFGLCIGQNSRDCATGSDWSNTSGSYRLTFDENGEIHPYVYLPFGSPGKAYDVQTAAVKRIARKADHAGMRLWDDNARLKLNKGAWNAVSMRMAMNSPNQANGYVAVTVNGITKELRGFRWRSSASIKITMLTIVSFYGGGDSSYKAPENMYMLFDDFRFSAS